MKLLLATNNAHKRDELVSLLGPLGVEILAPVDVGGLPAVAENQPTFAGNAARKATSAARAAREWALADDSGLEVTALGGAPGIRSARYAGEPANDKANNEKLLRDLAGVPAERRDARFVAALALANPDGEIVLELTGMALGKILTAPRGSAGFGYDPLFLFSEEGRSETGKTFAELGMERKSAVSHRGRALRGLAAKLPEILAGTC